MKTQQHRVSEHTDSVMVFVLYAISISLIVVSGAAFAVVMRAWGFGFIEWWHPTVVIAFCRVFKMFVIGESRND